MPSHGGFGAWFRQNVLNQFRYATVKNHEQDESLARSPLELRRTIETLEHKRYPTSNQRTPKDSNATASEKTKYGKISN